MKRIVATLISGLIAGSAGQATPVWDCQPGDGGWLCTDSATGTRILTTPGVSIIPTLTPAPGPAPSQPATVTPAAALQTPTGAWATCPPQPAQNFQPRASGSRDSAPSLLSAARAARDAAMNYSLVGDAVLERADQRIKAQHIRYKENQRLVEAEGAVRYDEPDLTMTASHGAYWLDEERGEFHDTQFRFYTRHGRGEAETAYLDAPGLTRYERAMYTTCADGSKAWRIKASRVTIDEAEGEGVARNARLEIQGVPLLYSPYLAFPIDDRRKTGFLVPSLGSSNNSGFDLRIPYYLNLAPNYDATLTPRYLQDRGAQINTEFRYLNSAQNGILNVEYMPDDKLTGGSRNRVIFRDTTRIGSHLSTRINFDRVSDKQYLEDLGDSLSLASITHLQRTAEAGYNANAWALGIRLDDYQTVDPTIAPANRPYQRLPRVTFSLAPASRPLGLAFRLQSEYVRFRQDERVNGSRLDLSPRLSLPLQRRAYEITPTLGVRSTRYQLVNLDPGNPPSPSRTTPLFSLDSRLFLERNLTLAGRSYVQTLEPRLFYLYVAGRDQDDIPLFDTSVPTFTYRELFEENRFNGADRMGDANQVALALSTRLLDPRSGAQRVRASIGELFFFQNRNVTLNNTPAQTRKTSDIAAELEVALSDKWSARGDMVWNPSDRQSERGNLRLQYRPGFRQVANLSYRYQRASQNQIDASLLWPLSAAWHVVGRWYYDLDDSKVLETLGGIEYDSCCWGIRLVARNFVDNTDKENNTVFMLQLVLKGLTRFGSDIESILEDGILGYTRSPED